MTWNDTVRNQSVRVTEVIDGGDRWAIKEGEPDPGWWYVLKSVVPEVPRAGTTYRLTTLHTGCLSPEVVALEDAAGVGYGRSRREIEHLVVKDAIEELLTWLSEFVWAAGWEADLPLRVWDLLFELPDPGYPFAINTANAHDAVVEKLTRLLEMTVAYGWWFAVLHEPDERGSWIRAIPLVDWNGSRPQDQQIQVAGLPQLLRQLAAPPASASQGRVTNLVKHHT